MNVLSAAFAGFSAVACCILSLVYLFSLPEMQKTLLGKATCLLLMLTLAALQMMHVSFFIYDSDLLGSREYLLLLALVPVSFYFFFRELLFHGTPPAPIDLVHALPLLCALVLPVNWVVPAIFAAGCVYTFTIYRKVIRLRTRIPRYRFERFFFALFFAMTILGLILGLALPAIEPVVFYHAYAGCLSIAMVLVVTALLVFPQLLTDVWLASETVYSKSKLEHINVSEKREQLERLMLEDQLYENEGLTLSVVADQLGLTSHQLSELVNTSFDVSFPRYIRDHRVRAAKRQLLAEPEASVLSIGLATGFKSQSSFYAAFRECTGQTPAAYRKENQAS